jgi:hypothetical protein
VIGKEWRACPVARLNLDYSIKFYRQLKGIFKVNVAAAVIWGCAFAQPQFFVGRPYQEFLWH